MTEYHGQPALPRTPRALLDLIRTARASDCDQCRDLSVQVYAHLQRSAKRKRLAAPRGQKPYGALPGEADTLSLILAQSRAGRSADAIALNLNMAGFRSRRGTPWYARVIKRIVAREGGL